MRAWLLLAALLTVPCPVVADDEISDVQDVVFLGDDQPVLLRFHVRVNGKPFPAAFEEFIAELMKFGDRDTDGVLTREEADRLPQPQVLFAGNFPGFQVGGPQLDWRAIDSDGNGKATKTELAAYYRQAGGDPFNLMFGQGQGPASDLITNSLYKELDTDKDGKLSREELGKAATTLFVLDRDDDELVSFNELARSNPLPYGGFGGGAVVLRQPGGNAPPPANAAFLRLGREDQTRTLAHQLLARYSTDPKQADLPIRKQKLSRAEIGIGEALFRVLDADRDGGLDVDELARFHERPADVELVVRLGEREKGESALELVGRQGKDAKPTQKATDSVVLTLGNAQIELRLGSNRGDQAFRFDIKQVYTQQFMQADRDNNGYLDKKEATDSRVFASLFPKADSDSDGMLFEKELLAFVEKQSQLQTKAGATRTTLVVNDRGSGLFDLLDTNRDGRLGLRELRNAAANLLRIDANKDERLARAEIPRNFELAMQQGAGGAFYPGRVVVAFDGSITDNRPPAAEPTDGPVWFRKMDRNRDGDISRREFLGGPEVFRKLDIDADGLIDRDEAEKADEAYRTKAAANKK